MPGLSEINCSVYKKMKEKRRMTLVSVSLYLLYILYATKAIHECKLEGGRLGGGKGEGERGGGKQDRGRDRNLPHGHLI